MSADPMAMAEVEGVSGILILAFALNYSTFPAKDWARGASYAAKVLTFVGITHTAIAVGLAASQWLNMGGMA